MDIASACLVGKKCRYDGKSCENEMVKQLYLTGKVKAVCPECLGRLPVPRRPSEIVGGDGTDVLRGTAKVLAKDGNDTTKEYLEGAYQALAIAKSYGACRAYLKSKSPSCGYRIIYDGTFSGTQKKGDGVTSALLRENSIEVIEI